jgi:hypothetical protein
MWREGAGGGANTARETANERTHTGGEREQEMGGDDVRCPRTKPYRRGRQTKEGRKEETDLGVAE